jgi:hypothetical protein
MAIPFVSIELDKVYNLRFGMDAQVEFEQLSGMACAEIEDNASMTTYAKVLWAMMRSENENITFKEVLQLVDNHAPNSKYVYEKIGEAVRVSFESDAAKNELPPKVK